jgi:preprotein translocase subunit SecF
MKQKTIAMVFSVVLCVSSLTVLMFNGLNLGLDFTGGTELEMQFKTPPNLVELREVLQENGFEEALVQTYALRDISIRLGLHQNLTQVQLKSKVNQIIPNGRITSVEYIGPQVGKTLFTKGILAILIAMIGTVIYISLRFEYRFAFSALIALFHDPLLILGIFSLFHLEFNLIVLAGLLTAIGYSLNDTVVVYDRVRENVKKIRKKPLVDIINLSINQTLSRTIMTSGLTMLVVLILFILGGQMIHNFALALMIGIVIGTYSSVYVAGALALQFGLTRASLAPVSKRMHSDA